MTPGLGWPRKRDEVSGTSVGWPSWDSPAEPAVTADDTIPSSTEEPGIGADATVSDNSVASPADPDAESRADPEFDVIDTTPATPVPGDVPPAQVEAAVTSSDEALPNAVEEVSSEPNPSGDVSRETSNEPASPPATDAPLFLPQAPAPDENRDVSRETLATPPATTLIPATPTPTTLSPASSSAAVNFPPRTPLPPELVRPIPPAGSAHDVSRETVHLAPHVTAGVEVTPTDVAPTTDHEPVEDVSRETSTIGPDEGASAPSLQPAPTTDVSRETADDEALSTIAVGDWNEAGANEISPDAAAESLELAETVDASTDSADASEAAPESAAPSPSPAPPPPLDLDTVWPKPKSRRVMTVANQKGGVGKTTTTVNIAAALAQHGVRVLVVDLDPQGNASTAFSVAHQSQQPSIYDVLIGERTLAEVAVAVEGIPNLWCAPATIDLAGAEIELVSMVARESRLKRALDAIGDEVDYVLIDCPPSLGLLTLNAMVAASEVFIPIQCEFYALEGLSQLLNNVQLVKSHLNPELFVSTILLTMYDARTRLADQVAAEVRSHFGELVLDSVIPRSVRISEAPGFGQTVVTFDPSSRGARAYSAAALDLARRGERGVI